MKKTESYSILLMKMGFCEALVLLNGIDFHLKLIVKHSTLNLLNGAIIKSDND